MPVENREYGLQLCQGSDIATMVNLNVSFFLF